MKEYKTVTWKAGTNTTSKWFEELARTFKYSSKKQKRFACSSKMSRHR